MTEAEMMIDFEFDSVFTVDHKGLVTERHDLYAPSVTHVDGESSPHDIHIDGAGWTPLTGWTNQYGYRGAVMHASEQFAGSMANHVLSAPGTYALVVVDCLPTVDDEDPEPAGWAVLRMDDV